MFTWYVLHSLEFVAAERRITRPGEVDFVLLHRRFGMIVLEVKDGQYRVEKRRWTLVRRDGVEIPLDTDPVLQAKDNRYLVSNVIKDRTGLRKVPAGHCVLFANGRPSASLGPHAPDAIVLSLADLAEPGKAIRRVVDHWDSGSWASDADFELALSTLCPTSVVAPTIGYQIDVARIDLERLTAHQIEFTTEQLKALNAMLEDRQAVVLGAAGTGKTVIAQERARRLAADGATVALIGQHSHLRLQLRTKMRFKGVFCGDPSDVLADLYGAEAVAPYHGESPWVAALALAESEGRRLDHLIVDEAQSQDEDVLEAMKHLVRPGGGVLLLADPYQRDGAGAWKPSGEYDRIPLTKNCRNVHPIAKLVARLSGAPAPLAGAPGAMPEFTESADPATDAVAVVRTLLPELAADRIVVLTETAASQQAVRMGLLRARVDASVVTGLAQPGLLVSKVDEFRGCEAEVIVYVTDRPSTDDRTADYIAVSRACAYLHVVGPRARWESVAYLMGDRP